MEKIVEPTYKNPFGGLLSDSESDSDSEHVREETNEPVTQTQTQEPVTQTQTQTQEPVAEEDGWTTVSHKKKRKPKGPAEKILVCSWCKLRFIFGVDEQERFSKLNFDVPRRCKECNYKRKMKRREKEAKKAAEAAEAAVEPDRVVIEEEGKTVTVQTI